MQSLELIDGWSPDVVAIGVIDREGRVASRGPVGEVLPWASVTKPLSALTVLTLVGSGDVDLDEPAGPEGSTVRHLLAHAAGYPFDGVTPMQPVGARRVYSNTGFEVLAGFVEERTGSRFSDIVAERVTAPLGMSTTVLEGSAGKAARGSLRDLLTLGHELLTPTLIDADLHLAARTVQFPGLAGVLPGYGRQDPNDWGLGWEIRGSKSPHWTSPRNTPETYGHFGQSGSFVWVDPQVGVAVASLASEPFGKWAIEAWPEVSSAVLQDLLGPA